MEVPTFWGRGSKDLIIRVKQSHPERQYGEGLASGEAKKDKRIRQ